MSTSAMNIPKEMRGLVGGAAKTVLSLVPSLFCGLNVAQYRALKSMYTLDANGRRPLLNIISFANGVGKTHLAVLDMVGWCLGAEYLNWRHYPKEAIDWYNSDKIRALRDSGKLSLRLTCDAVDMKDGGSVLMLLADLFPMAKPVNKDQLGRYQQIDIPHPSIPGIVNHIAVRTFDQKTIKHAGSTCHQIWINEPMPDELIGETIGRVRSKTSSANGSISMFATIVGNDASWVNNLDGSKIAMSRSRGHIYENCEGKAVTAAMAHEVKASTGNVLQKDEQNGGYITNGVLSKTQIDEMIESWRIISPDELEARMCGAPVVVGGKVYSRFKREIHVTDNYEVNPAWPVFQVADPHSARPTFSIWAQVTPFGRIFIFDEWPGTDQFPRYEEISNKPYLIQQECEIWTRKESAHGIRSSSVTRLGDPNRFLDPDAGSGETLQAKFRKYGFDFKIDIVDNMAVGHEVVNEYLYCDEARLEVNKEDTSALPKLYIHKRCVNVINALSNYAFKKSTKVGASVSENIDQKYKDPADTVRYLVVHASKKNYEELTGKSDASNSDYVKYRQGRLPAAYRDAGKSIYGVALGARRPAYV